MDCFRASMSRRRCCAWLTQRALELLAPEATLAVAVALEPDREAEL